MDDHQQRLITAGSWIARMDRGLSTAEEELLQEWMHAHPKNAEVVLSMTRNWDEMDEMSRLAKLFPEHSAEPKSQRRLAWVTAAATVAVVMAVATLLPSVRSVVGSGETTLVALHADTYETTVGGHSTVTLSDGTIVVLNTNSRLLVSYSDRARVLSLERGEIHVEVAEDVSRPLSVIADNRILQAVGTAFSVQITHEQQIELVVTEGQVVVGIQASGDQASDAPPILVQSSANTIAAGEEIVLGTAVETAMAVSAEDIEVKLSWREGRLIFRGESLEAALTEVERYTTVRFVFLEQDLKTREVTGRFRAGDVDGLLIALRTNFNIAYERSEDGRILLSSL